MQGLETVVITCTGIICSSIITQIISSSKHKEKIEHRLTKLETIIRLMAKKMKVEYEE